MPNADAPVLRCHVLQRLVRLAPENNDVEAIDRFVQERQEILQELESITTPWTDEDRDILEAAMRHAEMIMADLEQLQRQIASQINNLQGAWTSERSVQPLPARLTRRY
ncbi:MAG: hypothetical protein EOO77_12205 [Oxalobacteraceae bacterium]|nr:MAG: hypothetical protein EOO77_12205 [Oxalobacteraceae bacterium]